MGSRRAGPRASEIGVTRREWAVVATAAVAAAPLVAQVTTKTPPQGSPAPVPAAATPEQKLQKAYADVHETSERLAKIEVPMDIEPAFSFRP